MAEAGVDFIKKEAIAKWADKMTGHLTGKVFGPLVGFAAGKTVGHALKPEQKGKVQLP